MMSINFLVVVRSSRHKFNLQMLEWKRKKNRVLIPCQRKISIFREIFRNYRLGLISRQMIIDFILFKIRMWTTQKLENGLLTLRDDSHNLIYYSGDRRYCIRFPKNRGVRQITRVTTLADAQNITDEIQQLMGPGHNFHGIPTSPKLLGYPQGLKVKYRSGIEITYRGSTTIDLSSHNTPLEI